MKTVMGSVDKIHISYYSFAGLGSGRTVALYDLSANVLEVVSGYGKFLSKALKVLRKYQEEHNIPKYPVKVEYW